MNLTLPIMLHQIQSYIEKHRLLETGSNQPVLVGLSGGADSVALLAVLTQLGYPCVALHCNFHLRGDEAMRDEAFARQIARQLGVPFLKTDFDTRRYAEEKHLSIEMAARELRYHWFEEQRIRQNAQAIAVAHHRDDNAETLLLNLVRGSGIRGVRGMRPKNGFVVRPLLSTGRKEIMEWLEHESLGYVTDSTNLSDEYTRNFIRLRIIPLLETINPAARQNIARTAEHLSAAEAIYTHTVEEIRKKVWSGNRLDIPALMAYPAPETLLYEMLHPYGFSRPVCATIYNVLEKDPGKQFLSEQWRLVSGRNYLQLSPRENKEPASSYPISLTESEIYHPVHIQIQHSAPFSAEKTPLIKDKNMAYFDFDKLKNRPLSIRHWEKGDWFIPFGMKGRKKVSDFFTDRKYNLFQKENAWILTSGKDILWIVGERTDDRFKIDQTTKHALILKFLPEK